MHVKCHAAIRRAMCRLRTIVHHARDRPSTPTSGSVWQALVKFIADVENGKMSRITSRMTMLGAFLVTGVETLRR